MARLHQGSKVGRFQVTAFIGAGEIAEVYEIRDPRGSVAALKLYSFDAARAEPAWHNFQRESQAFANAAGGAAAPVYEFGVEPQSNLPYVIRERIPIASLHDEVLTHGPLSAPRVAAILQALAKGLDAAHARGLVHRGIKPQNLFTNNPATGEPAVVRLTDSSNYLLRPAAGIAPGWAGTPGWVAPDATDPQSASTPRMDVYALGLLCFFALTGRPFFKVFTRPTINFDALWNEMVNPVASASQQAKDVGSGLGSALDPWFAQAIAPHPKGRFASVSEMAAQFAAKVAAPGAAPRASSAAALPRGATQLGIGPLPATAGGTLVLSPGQSPAGSASPGAASPHQAAPPRGMSGTLILGSSAAVPSPGAAPPLPQHTAVLAPGTGTLRANESIRPAANIASEQGPVALASGQPLAYMSEFPRGAPAPPPEATIAAPFGGPPPGDERPSGSGSVPGKRSLLLPLLFFAALGLLALIALAVWVIRGRSSAEEKARLSTEASASASAAAAPPVKSAAPNTAASNTTTPTPAAAPAGSAEAEAGPTEGTIELTCEPACEQVECDGQPLEIAEGTAHLSPGSHQCRFERPGYTSKIETLTVQSGSNPRHVVRLFAARPTAPGPIRNSTAPAPTKKPCGTFINPCK